MTENMDVTDMLTCSQTHNVPQDRSSLAEGMQGSPLMYHSTKLVTYWKTEKSEWSIKLKQREAGLATPG